MAVVWVAGTTAVFGSGTSLAATTMSGILDNDGLFAFVMTRSPMTPPAGWVIVASGSGGGSGVTQYLYFVQKTTVTAADSSTAFTWTQSAGVRIGVTYAQVRGDGGKITVSQTSVNQQSFYYNTTLNVPSLTATAQAGEVFLGGTSSIVLLSPFTATPPSGMTLWTGGGTDHRMSAAYQACATGQANATSWTITNDSNENGPVGIMARVRDAAIPAGTLDIALLEDALWQIGTLVDGVQLAPSVVRTSRTPQEVDAGGVRVANDNAFPVRGVGVTALEAASLLDTLLRTRLTSQTATEEIDFASLMSVRATFTQVALERMRLQESLRRAHALWVVDAATVNDALQVVRGVAVLERLGLAPIVAAHASSRVTVVERAQMLDALARMLGATVADAALMVDVLARRTVAHPQVTEGLGLTDTSLYRLVVRAEVEEQATAGDVLQAFWRATVSASEMVQLSGAFFSPTEIVTWAINTRTGAATNYTQFPYTSFARRGNRYLATADDGLYELNGDTDNGTAIIAEMESGFLQFAGSRFTSFKAIYLGMHGTGNVFFRLETGDGKQYTYRVVAQDMETTKVRVGKGLRARYFSFALVTVGQDFDLDTVEFLPIGAQRRV